MTNIRPELQRPGLPEVARVADTAPRETGIDPVQRFYSGQRWRAYLLDMLDRLPPWEGQEKT